MRPGNWLDVAPDEEIPTSIEGWDRTLIHMHQITFAPEIRRRRDAGILPADFSLWAGQLIQPHEGGRIVRLNNEVRGVPYIRAGRPFEKGDPVLFSDLEGLESFDLHDDELDCGHFTIFWTGSSWFMSFDFRAGRAKCLALVEKAQAFISASRMAVEKGLAEPAIDTMHTACELLAKARLILSHYPAHEWRSHSSISSHINREGRMGNVDAAFLALFNRLSAMRNPAKYATGYEAELLKAEDIELAETVAASLHDGARQKRPEGGPEGG